MIRPPDKLVPVAPLEAYTFDPTPYDWGRLLAPFTPPLPREGQVIVASLFGDVFVEDRHGAVWWVNGMEERVDRIGISRNQFLERVAREHVAMLKTKLMELLFVSDKLVKAGMLYGLKTPRSQGGKYEIENIGTASVEDTFAYLGGVYRQKKAAEASAVKAPEAAPAPVKKNGFWGKKK